MKTLTLEHLKYYLDCELKMKQNTGRIYTLRSLSVLGMNLIDLDKPILRPLSDYTDINSKAMNDLNWDLSLQIQLQEMATQGGWWNYSALLIKECAKEHIDFQNLIPDGLAVDKNTIEL